MNELKYFWGATTTGSCLLSAKPLQVNTVYLAFTCVQLPACSWTAEWDEGRQKSLTFFTGEVQWGKWQEPPCLRRWGSVQSGEPGEGGRWTPPGLSFVAGKDGKWHTAFETTVAVRAVLLGTNDFISKGNCLQNGQKQNTWEWCNLSSCEEPSSIPDKAVFNLG